MSPVDAFHFLEKWWVVIGFVLSALLGTRAALNNVGSVKSRSERWTVYGNRFQEFLQNFVGSFAGWACVGVLLTRIDKDQQFRNVGAVDGFLFVAAVFGTSGRLAETVHKFIDGIGSVAGGLTKKLAGTDHPSLPRGT